MVEKGKAAVRKTTIISRSAAVNRSVGIKNASTTDPESPSDASKKICDLPSKEIKKIVINNNTITAAASTPVPAAPPATTATTISSFANSTITATTTNPTNPAISGNNRFSRKTPEVRPATKNLKQSVNGFDDQDLSFSDTDDNNNSNSTGDQSKYAIPEVLRKQGTATYCSGNADNNCPCNTMEDAEHISKQVSFCNRKSWISVERLSELRKRAHEAIKNHKTFTIRGCFFSVRNALAARGWVEKLDIHRKNTNTVLFQVSFEDIAQALPKRRPGETRRQYLIKCERNIMSRFLEHLPIDFLWTARKEKCDYIDQAKNPVMLINKFHRVPFTSKEGLCTQLRDFHWYYEEGTAELYFPRCYNVWSPEELNDFVDNFRITGCLGFLKWFVYSFKERGYDAVFAASGKVPSTVIDFAFKRLNEFLDFCYHNDIDSEESIRVWEHDWDAFLLQHYILTHEDARIQLDPNKLIDPIMKQAVRLLESVKPFWPQSLLDGFLNIWIVKPANKCRGRGIHLMNNLKKILNIVNPSVAAKSRYIVQKYVERPLIIHNTKFDIRQWFLVTSVQPLVIWMYKESYLRFSSQHYNLTNYHESVHLTNHAVQKKYRNAKRDKRLPTENMWDCYTFQAYLRQIGQQNMWTDRIYPGMRRAITGAMLASQENMDRRSNTFELFGADFIISEDFYPWLIEINSSPDLGGTTSVTARMCPQCLEDVIKVVIDRKTDPKADTGNFELIYRQVIPPTPAYMGLNLFLKGRQITPKNMNAGMRREKTYTAGFQYTRSNSSRLSQNSANTTNSAPAVPAFQQNPYTDRSDSLVPTIMEFLDSSYSPRGKEPTSNSNNNNQTVFKKNALTPSSFNSNNNSSQQKTDAPPTGLSSSRLLSPLVSANRNQDQQQPSTFTKSPTHRNIVKDAGIWRQTCEPKQKILVTQTFSRRHMSCGPRITTNEENSDQAQESSDQAPMPSDSKFECVGNKCSVENLNAVLTDGEPAAKSPPRSAALTSRKQIYELLYKSKSARLARPSRALVKPKSSPVALSSSAIRRNYLSSVKKLSNYDNTTTCSKLQKGTTVKNTTATVEVVSSQFHAVGMSLRAWRSRHYKLLRDTSGTQLNAVACKSAPACSPIRASPKRQLCKTLTKKTSGSNSSRGNTGA